SRRHSAASGEASAPLADASVRSAFSASAKRASSSPAWAGSACGSSSSCCASSAAWNWRSSSLVSVMGVIVVEGRRCGGGRGRPERAALAFRRRKPRSTKEVRGEVKRGDPGDVWVVGSERRGGRTPCSTWPTEDRTLQDGRTDTDGLSLLHAMDGGLVLAD